MNVEQIAMKVADAVTASLALRTEWTDDSAAEDGRVGVILSDGTVFDITITIKSVE